MVIAQLIQGHLAWTFSLTSLRKAYKYRYVVYSRSWVRFPWPNDSRHEGMYIAAADVPEPVIARVVTCLLLATPDDFYIEVIA